MTDGKNQIELIRQRFKYFNRFMLLLWHLGLGKHINTLSRFGGRIMVITHTGRKSGARRRTPVNYAVVNGEIYCIAGFGAVSDWFRNIKANPQIEIWLPSGWWAGIAKEVTDEQIRITLIRAVLRSSGYAAQAFGMDPSTMTNEALEKAARGYRLVHINRTLARTGPGGPGEFSWIWPLAAMFLLPVTLILYLQRRR